MLNHLMCKLFATRVFGKEKWFLKLVLNACRAIKNPKDKLVESADDQIYKKKKLFTR